MKGIRSRRGQIGTMMALFLPALLGSISLGVDVGMLYYNWALLQKAADAAALAGASYLPYDPVDAQSQAVAFAEQNGIQPSEIVSTNLAPDDLSITVQLKRTVPFYFARVLGLVSGPVSASGTAGVQQNPNYTRGLMPVGLTCAGGTCNFQMNQLYQLKSSQAASGNWGALALGGSGSSVYRSNIENGYWGNINVGDWVSTKPGNVVGPTSQGFTDRINQGLTVDPNGTYASASSYDPRAVIFPIVNFSGATGNSVQVQIVGFARMWVDSLGSNGTINAYYLGMATFDSSQQTTGNFGTTTPILLQ
jgi:Putative Flp pilus-assembly TadE/G-like